MKLVSVGMGEVCLEEGGFISVKFFAVNEFEGGGQEGGEGVEGGEVITVEVIEVMTMTVEEVAFETVFVAGFIGPKVGDEKA